jgi:Domain of unknown function (DUF4276)
MPSYGLIVEGVFDENVYPVLIRKIVSPESTIIVRQTGGVPKLLKLFPILLRELECCLRGNPVDKAIVIRDWSKIDRLECEEELRQRVRDKNFSFPHGIQFCCVRHEMEAWLLADEEAINSVARTRSGREVARVNEDVEEIRDPKGRLRAILAQAGLPYDPQVCGEIARAASLERLRYRCPCFRVFEERVLD